MNCDGLMQIVVNPAASCSGIDVERPLEVGHARRIGERAARPADHLELVDAPARRGHRRAAGAEIPRPSAARAG